MSFSPVDNNKIRQLTFYLLLVFLFIFLFLQMNGFLSAFLGAITFYMLSRKIMRNLVEKRKWKKSLAAALILFISLIVIVLPIWLLVNILTSRIGYVISNSNEIIASVNTFIQKLEARFHVDLMASLNPSSISSTVANTVRNILTATFNSLSSLVVMYFILYFMLVSRKQMEQWMYEFIPLKYENIKALGKEMKNLVISNAIGIPMVAILQGLVGLVAYIFLGVNDVWFWFTFSCIGSILPFVGAALAYVPLSIVLFAHHQNWQGTVLLIYGITIIGTVDNIFRFMLVKKMGDVHPLITVLGVVVGLNVFGFIGIIFGPILISIFITLVKIYTNEFIEDKKPAMQEIEIPPKT